VNLLLQYGASPKIRNERRQYPLHLAVKGEHYEVVRAILNKHPDAMELRDLVNYMQNGKKPWQYSRNAAITQLFVAAKGER
jgi:hypothetical protein